MTDKEKIKTIIKQYADKGERLLEDAYKNDECASTTGYWDGYRDCANLLLRELEDMQEEPESHKPKITLDEATGKLKELLDNMKDSAAKDLGLSEEDYNKAIDECLYGKESELVDDGDLPKEESKAKFKVGDNVMYLNEEYVITDNKDHYTLRSTKERTSVPVVHIDFGNEDYELRLVEESKKCMYSKDNYTAEDRKVLCDGCEEECEFNKKEGPVSEDFKAALAKEWQGYVDRGAATVDALEDNTQELAFAKGFYRGWNYPKSSVWHDANTLPSDPKAVIVEHNEYSTSICRAEQMSRVKGAKWAYIDDLLKL